MKITNISTTQIFLSDLRLAQESQTVGRRGEDRYINPGQSVYLPDTSEVLRSASAGDIFRFKQSGKISVDDVVSLEASGGADSVVLTHNFNRLPKVVVLKQDGLNWIDSTGTVNITHNSTFTQVTIENGTAFNLTFLISIS